MKKLNNSGFGAVEAMLIVVILAIIGGTGYYVYHTSKKSNDTLNSASQVASSPTRATPTENTKNAVISAVKSYWSQQGKKTDSVTVTTIIGENAKGDFHLTGDSGGASFIAHDDKGKWQVISTGQQKPGKAVGAKYNLPSSWYSSTY